MINLFKRSKPTHGKAQKKQFGFTLIELTIITAIMALLSGAAIMNFRGAEKRKAVKLASDTVINALRTTQTYSLSGKQIPSNATKVFNDVSMADCAAGSLIPADYRVIFMASGTSYGIYSQDKCNDVWLIEEGKMPSRTRVKSTGVNVDGVTYGGIQAKFSPPFARLTYSSSLTFTNPAPTFSNFSYADISVELSEGTSSSVVRLDAISGRIGEQ